MKILTVSTYPIDNPSYGGPIRVKAVHTVLRSSGHRMHHLCVEHSGQGVAGPDQTVYQLDSEYMRRLTVTGGRPDVDAAKYVLDRPALLDDALARMSAFAPDVVLVEQPWLWPLVKIYAAKSGEPRPLIGYASHNAEGVLTKTLLGSDTAFREVIARAEAIEDELCRSADFIVVVSKQDQAIFAKYDKKTLIAPNGVWPRPPVGGYEHWAKEFDGKSFVLYVASAHPPNAVGFSKMLGPAVNYLAPDERIVVVGGVASLLADHEDMRPYRGVNAARIVSVGVQNDGGLSTFLSLCKGVVLPLTEGGGTNLKTAEALFNRSAVIGTSIAFRGFEDFRSVPGVTISDSPDGFKKAVVSLLRSPAQKISRSFDDELKLDRLLWSSALAPLSAFISSAWGGSRPQAELGPQRNVAGDAEERRSYALRFGWHASERPGTWSKQTIAGVTVGAERSDDDVHVAFSLSQGLPNFPDVDFSVRSRNGVLETGTLRSAERSKDILIRLAAEDAVSPSERGFIIKTSRLNSPKDHGVSSDARELGIFISKVRIYRTLIKFSRRQTTQQGGAIIVNSRSNDGPSKLVLARPVIGRARHLFAPACVVDETGDFETILRDMYKMFKWDFEALANSAGDLKSVAGGRVDFVKRIVGDECAAHNRLMMLIEVDESDERREATLDQGETLYSVMKKSEEADA